VNKLIEDKLEEFDSSFQGTLRDGNPMLFKALRQHRKKALTDVYQKGKEEMFKLYEYIEFCGFLEESDQYLVVGFVTKEQAMEAIHNSERYEWGLGEDELYSLELRKVVIIETVKDNMPYYDWSKGNKTGKTGWVGSI